jgi:hypothetical protein
MQKKNLSCSDNFHSSPQIIRNYNLKNIFEIKSGYVTNETAKTCINFTFISTLHHVKQ